MFNGGVGSKRTGSSKVSRWFQCANALGEGAASIGDQAGLANSPFNTDSTPTAGCTLICILYIYIYIYVYIRLCAR